MTLYRPFSLLFLTAQLAAGCKSAAGPTEADPELIEVKVRVESPSPRTVEAGWTSVRLRTWTNDMHQDADRKLASQIPVEWSFASELLDPLRHDSVTIHVSTMSCSSVAPFHRRLTTDEVAGRSVLLVLERTRPLRQLEDGAFACGIGWRGEDDPSGWAGPFWLELRFESVSEQVIGTWFTGYQETRGGEEGTFVGEQVGGELVLGAEDTRRTFLGCEGSHTIRITTNAAGQLTTARLEGEPQCYLPTTVVELSDATEAY